MYDMSETIHLKYLFYNMLDKYLEINFEKFKSIVKCGQFLSIRIYTPNRFEIYSLWIARIDHGRSSVYINKKIENSVQDTHTDRHARVNPIDSTHIR